MRKKYKHVKFVNLKIKKFMPFVILCKIKKLKSKKIKIKTETRGKEERGDEGGEGCGGGRDF